MKWKEGNGDYADDFGGYDFDDDEELYPRDEMEEEE